MRQLDEYVQAVIMSNSLDMTITLPAPILDKEKKSTNIFYFDISLWCLKRFYEGLKGLYKTFLRHQKEVWK